MEDDREPWWAEDPELLAIRRRVLEEFECVQREPIESDQPDPVSDDMLSGARSRELAHARDDIARARARYGEAVRAARASGLSWSEIGRVLGVSKQQLHRRFRGPEQVEQRHVVSGGAAVVLTEPAGRAQRRQQAAVYFERFAWPGEKNAGAWGSDVGRRRHGAVEAAAAEVLDKLGGPARDRATGDRLIMQPTRVLARCGRAVGRRHRAGPGPPVRPANL